VEKYKVVDMLAYQYRIEDENQPRTSTGSRICGRYFSNQMLSKLMAM